MLFSPDCGAFSARRAAGAASDVPRVFGDAVDRVVAFLDEQKLWDVGLAEHDTARMLECSDGHGVFVAVMVAPTFDPERRWRADDLEVVLDGDGQAVKRTERFAFVTGCVGGLGGFACAVIQRQHDGGHLVPDGSTSGDQGIDDFHRRSFAFAKCSEERSGI